LLIKLYASLYTKTTISIIQTNFIVVITHNRRPYRLNLRLSNVQNFDPLQYISQVTIMRTSITDHSATKRTWYAWAELKTSPAKRSQLVQQSWPTHTCACNHECPIIFLLLNSVIIQRYTRYNASYPSISIHTI